jgi:hypothetical protein
VVAPERQTANGGSPNATTLRISSHVKSADGSATPWITGLINRGIIGRNSTPDNTYLKRENSAREILRAVAYERYMPNNVRHVDIAAERTAKQWTGVKTNEFAVLAQTATKRDS